MTPQPEYILENNLIEQLKGLDYSFVKIKDEKQLLANLKTQLEKHNKIEFTETEFTQVLNHLNKGNIFERAKILRDKMYLKRANGDNKYIEFIQQEQWCQNQYQVTNQISMEGLYKNRYDITLLINGLPLVQIELKRRGLELKEAFNQINRYQKHSFWSSYGLFQYVQMFIISNGVNTKYFANNRGSSFKQTFFWANENNKAITQLEPFAQQFLEPCHLSKMITKYTVLQQTDKILMVLRPYQFYAVEKIISRVKESRKNGYIWHTTGSGKTLTSFKASQILIEIPKVDKVVFVVDRKDLDYQTITEFENFSKGSVDATENTKDLIKQFNNKSKLIVTTIQKLNNAIHSDKHLSKMEEHKNERTIFIFDECHRSQFGETHKRIKDFFTKAQMFGFTGTPIFADNAMKNELGKRTTADLFENCLHKYVITDAIKDENVLKFSIEYIGKYKYKDESNKRLDIKVEDIDTQELLEAPQRLEKIINYIILNHDRKTHYKKFNAMFCVSSIDALIKYYDIFKNLKQQGKHNLKIATIFSYGTNEPDKEANGFIGEDNFNIDKPITKRNKHSREKLDEFIADYNKMFNCSYSTKNSQDFYNYYQHISKNVKNKNIDILLVVNMFLTGFDSKLLNTLYVDKNLKYHGLIQAFSRTNRIINETKSQGNIVSFRNLKDASDKAISLFSDKDAKEVILLAPYESYLSKFKEIYEKLLTIAPTINSVNNLQSEYEELQFFYTFRELSRLKNTLVHFADFNWNNLAMSEQDFEDYKSKYLDLYDKVRTNNKKEKVSILNDLDFELELLHRDEINIVYILKLLAQLSYSDNEPDLEKQKKEITDLLSGDVKLRSKRELIEQFIEKNIPNIFDQEDIPEEFDKYWQAEQKKAFYKICEDENLIPERANKIIDSYLFHNRRPLRDDIINARNQEPPSILQRKSIAERITDKLLDYVETFINNMDN